MAQVVEENILRRDKCVCPSCAETIYVCRTPGCDNYAKGGDLYDHELCPECTRAVGNVGMVAATAAAALIGTAAAAAILPKDD
jgi:hypothetical protein